MGDALFAVCPKHTAEFEKLTAKVLLCAKSDTRQIFGHDRPDDVARVFAVCFPGLAHSKG